MSNNNNLTKETIQLISPSVSDDNSSSTTNPYSEIGSENFYGFREGSQATNDERDGDEQDELQEVPSSQTLELPLSQKVWVDVPDGDAQENSNDEAWNLGGATNNEPLKEAGTPPIPPENTSIQRARRAGKKSGRDENQDKFSKLMEVMALTLKEVSKMGERQDKRNRREDKENIRLRKEIEVLKSDTASSATSGTEKNESGIADLVKDRATIETSRGVWKSPLLATATFPEEWPLYSWPKGWRGKHEVVGALMNLLELQKNQRERSGRSNTDPLKEAVEELKNRLTNFNRTLEPQQYQLLLPILNGVKEEHYPLAHEAWVLCLLGIRQIPEYTQHHLLICRSIPPVYMEHERHWNEIIEGREWPTVVTKGFRVKRGGQTNHNQIMKTTAQNNQKAVRPPPPKYSAAIQKN